MKASMKVLAGVLALGMCAFVAGCGDSQPSKTKQQGEVTSKIVNAPTKMEIAPLNEIKEGRKNVYAVIKVCKGAYWGEVVRGLKEGADKANVNMYMGGVLIDGNWELQRDMVKSLDGKKVDAVVLAVADSTNMTAVAKELKSKKLPVVLVDTGLNSKDYDVCYMTNNPLAGAKVAEKMLEMLKKNGVKETDNIEVKINISNLASSTLNDRMESAISYWRDKAPKSWVLSKKFIINNGDNERAYKLASEAIKKDPKIKGIIGVNNSSTGRSVQAVMDAGRKDVAVVGFDMNENTIKGIKSPDYKVATIMQNQYNMGFEAAKAALALAEGKTLPAKNVDTGIVVVDETNIK